MSNRNGIATMAAFLVLSAPCASGDFDCEVNGSGTMVCEEQVDAGNNTSIGGIPIGSIGGGTNGGGGAGTGVIIGHSPLPPNQFQQFRLDVGKIDAFTKLVANASCRGMWQEYGLFSDAATLISITSYRDGTNTQRCINSPNTLAWTQVGSSIVNLCRLFTFSSTDLAWLVPLHEAMHAGGMPEFPPTSGALASWQINQLIYIRCPC